MRLVLFGDPVAHSRSPAIHRAALAACGIEGTYEARVVDHAGLLAGIEEIRSGSLQGANVTMPHKGAAAAAADDRDGSVARTGAANTLRERGGRVEATNTDVEGIQDAAARAGIPAEPPILVLGAGGAAAATLAGFGARVAAVAARRPGAADALIREMGSGAEECPWDALPPGMVVVNATPLGMSGEVLPGGLPEGAAGLIDLAYRDAATPAVAAAAGLGVPCADGLTVLVAQAGRSFTWWTGLPAPLGVMEAAARRGV